MNDLTELWKKGELEQKYYYVQYKSLGKSWTEIELKGFLDDLVNCRDVDGRVSILAPVPSYEEYQKLLSDQLAKIEGEEINAELEAENTKLKELLESALSWLPDSSKLRGGRYAQLQNLKRKISEALK